MNADAVKFLYDILDGIAKIHFHIQGINTSVEFIQNYSYRCNGKKAFNYWGSFMESFKA